MGYKVLGYVVWRVARVYVRRRYPDLGRKALIGGVATTAAVGGGLAIAAAMRQRSQS